MDTASASQARANCDCKDVKARMSDIAGIFGGAAVLIVLLSLGYVYCRITGQIGPRGKAAVTNAEPEPERPPNEHVMLLWGNLGDARFPPLCPNCGNAATDTLKLSKIFWRSSGEESTQVVISVSVPFCGDCIAGHQAESPASASRFDLLSSLNGEMIGAAMVGVVAAWTGYHAAVELFHRRMDIFMVFAALCAVFALIANFLCRSAWRATEGHRVRPQTTVTRAFDYSDNDPPPFESPRYECTMRDARFAAAFRALNRHLEYRHDSPGARTDRRHADRETWIIGICIGIALLLFYFGFSIYGFLAFLAGPLLSFLVRRFR